MTREMKHSRRDLAPGLGRQRKNPAFQAVNAREDDAVRSSFQKGARLNPTTLACVLARADGATRSLLAARLQQERGNGFVQRVMSQSTAPNPLSAQTDLVLQRSPADDAVKKFKGLLKAPGETAGTRLATSGQFYTTNQLTEIVFAKIRSAYGRLSIPAGDSLPGLLSSVINSVNTRNFEGFRTGRLRFLGRLRALRRTLAPAQQIEAKKLEQSIGSLLGSPQTLRQLGLEIYNKVWKEIKANRAPDWARICKSKGLGLTLAAVMTVDTGEKVFCDSTARHVIALAKSKTGKPASAGVASFTFPNPKRALKGIEVNRMEKGIAILKKALDRGDYVRVAVCSGRRFGTPNHYIVTIAYQSSGADTEVIFWDPDSGAISSRYGPAFGILHYRSSGGAAYRLQTEPFKYRAVAIPNQ